MIKQLWEFKETDRKWHFPVIAGLSIGIPLLGGYFTSNMQGASLASMGGLVILYIHTLSIVSTMATLMACSFGMMVSFSIGALFGFHPWIAALVLGLFAFIVHRSLYFLQLTRPPGNFFFILIASLAICMPYNLKSIPEKVGYIGIGAMIACTLALVYGLLVYKKYSPRNTVNTSVKSQSVNLVESVTFGLIVGISLLVASLLQLRNPYWVPTSCVAVMQGSTTSHVWLRSIQRTLGTFVGLGVTWVILLLQPSLLTICISIILVQMLVEWLVVRNYGIAVIFITVLSILLAESANTGVVNPTTLIKARFFDIVTGSIMGVIGGWLLYNERLQRVAKKLESATAALAD